MSRTRTLLIAATTLIFASVTLGQTGGQLAARPDRGPTPGGAYSVSDIDSVSLTGGALSLSIPLASLPPIAGGQLGVTITARYNSKLWNVWRRERLAPGLGFRTYVVDEPQPTDGGGWTIDGPRYDVRFREASEDFTYLTPQQDQTSLDDWQQIQHQWWRAYLLTPDGAEHELTPSDPAHAYSGTTRTYLIGSFRDTPLTRGAPMRYHTTDGTYLSVVYHPDGTWAVTSPGGMRAAKSSDGSQRITDANGNSVLIYADAEGTQHYVDEQTGRGIKVEPTAAGRRVSYRAVGGAWQHVDVNFGSTRVRGKVFRVNDWNASAQTETGQEGAPCVRHETLDKTLTVVREIVFPSTEPHAPGRRFAFEYNSDATETFTADYAEQCGVAPAPRTITASRGLGELSGLTTPPGATAAYAYAHDAQHLFTLDSDEFARNTVRRKEVRHDDDAAAPDRWEYEILWNMGGGSVKNPDGTSFAEWSHVSDPGYGHQRGTPSGLGGRVVRTRSGNVVVERRWRPGLPDAYLAGPSGLVAVDPVVEAEFTTLLEPFPSDAPAPALMSAKTYQYDLNGNLLQTKEYDWFDPALVGRDATGVPLSVPESATLLRQTDTSFHNPADDAASANLYSRRATSGTTLVINAPRETRTGGGATRFSYDGREYGLPPTRGHVTRVARLDDRGDADPSNDTWAETATAYDDYGNVAATTDPLRHVTRFYYDDDTHARPTSVVFDPGNGTGEQTSATAYDFHTGLPISETDVNGQTSEISYVNQLTGEADPFGRPGVTTAPAVDLGGVSRRRRVYTFYKDAARQVCVETDLREEGDRRLKSCETRDRLGRVVLTESNEGGAALNVSARTVYLEAGRVTLSSVPRRAGDTQPGGWTRKTLDEMGRVAEVATFGGTAQPPASGAGGDWLGSVRTSYHANRTTVTDQQGKARRGLTDALGRLVRVDEPDAATGALDTAAGAPAQPTHYTYDPLGNLRAVDQGGQRRFFLYDALGRLVRAKNPEQGVTRHAEVAPLTDPLTGNSQWSAAYAYDAAGRLTARYDARDIKTAYQYDALGRPTLVDYSDTAQSPDVTRTYDGAALGKGRPWHSFAGGDEDSGATVRHTAVDAYDALGRPLAQRQRFKTGGVWAAPYTVARTYTLSGAVRTQTYPSGHSVAYEYDDAGRLAGFAGDLGDGRPRAYTAGAAYDAAGRMTAERFGTDTPLYHGRSYNVAGQLTEVRVGTQPASDPGRWDRGKIVNRYTDGAGPDGPDNNGNLRRQDIYVPHAAQPGSAWVANQRFSYDALNRLTRVVEAQGGADRWAQSYDYDRWGNRTINAVGTEVYGPNPTHSVPEPQFDKTALPATNRLYAPGDMQPGTPESARKMRYDGAGNLTHDLCHDGVTQCARAFDAENRITEAQFLNGNLQTVSYTYDADGRRVTRAGGREGQVRQVYGFDGELLAEYAPQDSPASPRKEYGYRAGELLVTAEAPEGAGRANFALAAAGATASSSSTLDAGRPPSGAIDGDRAGHDWGAGGGWHDATEGHYPDWLAVDFGAPRIVDEVSVFSVQDTFWSPQEPSEAAAFTRYGLVDFDVQGWDEAASAWVTVPGGAVRGNNMVWRKVRFAPVNTRRVRVLVHAAQAGFSRVAELEAWGAVGPPPPRTNFAAAAEGATAVASSTFDAGRAAAGAINGDRAGRNWGAGGGWHCATNNAYPDWLEVRFAAPQTVDEVHVFSVQNNFLSPAEPTEQTTFSLYGLRDFEVQWWDGDAWRTAAAVADNQLVWRRLTFTPVTTARLRVLVTSALAGYSRLAEVEAYGPAPRADLRWLVADHLRTTRMVFDRTGSLSGVGRHDYLPFGEEIGAGWSGRTTAQGFRQPPALRHQFTGYERDDETGLDYAQARYYSSRHGRFTSVDPLLASGAPATPQSWNRYAYAFNSPLMYVDPTGLVNDYFVERDGYVYEVETDDDVDRFYYQDNGPGFSLVATLERNSAGLVRFPDRGRGFDRYGMVDAGGADRNTGTGEVVEQVGQGDHFLQPTAAAALFGLTARLNEEGITLSLGDMSSSNGSDPWQAGQQHHAGHGHLDNRAGLDVDFRYLNGEGVSFQSQSATTDAQFSAANNQKVFDRASQFGFTVNYQGTAGNPLTGPRRVGGHNDHGHIGFGNGGKVIRADDALAKKLRSVSRN